ncbi:MAG: 50S ribosomal protein L18 [archaeon]
MMYRRKQEGRTNYKLRLKLLQSKRPRLVIRKSNKHILVQVVHYAQSGDIVKASATTKQLPKYGWTAGTNNIPAAYLAGFLLGKNAVKADTKDAIVDLGMQVAKKGNVLYAVVKGAIDAGMVIPCSEEAFPTQERLVGKHIQVYAGKAQQHHFAKTKQAALDLPALVQKTKENIVKS